MPTNLVETASSLVTPELVHKAAHDAGESPENTRSAMLGAVPTLFAGLLHGASGEDGPSKVLGLVTRTAEGSTGGAPAEGAVSNLFGSHADAVTGALASSAGVRKTSSARILGLVAPLVMGLLHKEATSRGLNAIGFSEMLSQQKRAIADDPHTPPGLAAALGLSPTELGPSPVADQRRTEKLPSAAPVEVSGERGRPIETKHRSRWGYAIPLLLIAGLAVWGLSSLTRSHPNVSGNAPAPTTPTTQPVARAPTEMQGNPTVVPMGPNASGLGNALDDTATQLPRAFSLDGVNFEIGQSTPTADSAQTLDALAATLRAHPTARVRAEGNADIQGQAPQNQALSIARATAIKDALVTRGIDPNRIETTGMGQERQSATNDTAAGRPENTRADIVLLSR